MNSENNAADQNLDIVQSTKECLKKISATAKKASILGLICSPLLGFLTGVIFYLGFEKVFPMVGYKFFLIISFGLALAIYIIPFGYIFRFSKKMKNAIINENQESLEGALKDLRMHMMSFSILLIILAMILFPILIVFIMGSLRH